MKIWIPKNREQLRQHLHDPLFKNAYFLMGNTLLSAGAGFFFGRGVAITSPIRAAPDIRFAQSDYFSARWKYSV